MKWPSLALCAAASLLLILLGWQWPAAGSPRVASPSPDEALEQTPKPALDPAETPSAGRLRPEISPPTAEGGKGFVELRDVAGGGKLVGIVLDVEPDPDGGRAGDSADPRATSTSDEGGKVHLAQGAWILDATRSGFGPPGVRVSVGKEAKVVWLHREVRLSVQVQDAMGRVVPGANVSLCRSADDVIAGKQTDESGLAVFEPVYGSRGLRVQVHHRGFDPALLALPREILDGDPAPFRVRLDPVSSEWTLVVLDQRGQPLSGAEFFARGAFSNAPPIPIGVTGADGELKVRGRWMFGRSQWSFGGRAFPSRISSPSQIHGDSASREVVVVPRRCSGTIRRTSQVAAPVSWWVLDPHRASDGSGILPNSFAMDRGVDSLTLDLPELRPVRLEARRQGTVLFSEVVEVGADRWELPVTLMEPVVGRVLHLRCSTPSIARVGRGEEQLFPRELGQPAAPASTVSVSIGREPMSLRVQCVGGAEFLLVAEAGESDADIAFDAPPLVPVAMQLQGADGTPVVDAVVRCTAVNGRGLASAGPPGWHIMAGRNITRLHVGPDGVARGSMVPGLFDVEIANIEARDELGLLVPALAPRQIEVRPSANPTFVLTVERPRRVDVELVRPPGQGSLGAWTLVVGTGMARFGGDRCSVWLTESAQDLQVFDEVGSLLGSAHLGQGSQGTLVRIPVQAAR